MKKLFFLLRNRMLLLLIFGLMALASCKILHLGHYPVVIKNYVNWNFIFKPSWDSARRAGVIADINRQILLVRTDSAVFIDSIRSPISYMLFNHISQRLGTTTKWKLINPQDHFCSCKDTLLWNLTADLEIDGTGGSLPSNPPPPDKTKVGGDIFDEIDSNGNLTPQKETSIIDPTSPVSFGGQTTFTDSVILGIIDTGIDSALFSDDTRTRLFATEAGRRLAVNVIPGADSNNYYDDNHVKHGTSVAAIALKAAFDLQGTTPSARLPKLMIIRAMDKDGNGTTLSLSCALSYAVRHHAQLVNASLGYYGQPNTVLTHYLNMASENNLLLVAAAGNADTFEGTPCNTGVNTANLLKPGRLFFPACQSIDSRLKIITVTGMQDAAAGTPCYWQNYSDVYVNIGVQNNLQTAECCVYRPNYIHRPQGLTGSSFATPVVSGELSYMILKGGSFHSTREFINMLRPRVSTTHRTAGGMVITY